MGMSTRSTGKAVERIAGVNYKQGTRDHTCSRTIFCSSEAYLACLLVVNEQISQHLTVMYMTKQKLSLDSTLNIVFLVALARIAAWRASSSCGRWRLLSRYSHPGFVW